MRKLDYEKLMDGKTGRVTMGFSCRPEIAAEIVLMSDKLGIAKSKLIVMAWKNFVGDCERMLKDKSENQ